MCRECSAHICKIEKKKKIFLFSNFIDQRPETKIHNVLVPPPTLVAMHGHTLTTKTLGGAFGWVPTARKTYTGDNDGSASGPKLVFFIQVHLAILKNEKTSVKYSKK